MKRILSGFGAMTFIGLVSTGAVCTFYQPAAAQSPAWKTVSDAKTGISVSMPSGTVVKPSARTDAQTGSKIASVEASSQTDTAIYLLTAIRLNASAIKELQKTMQPGQEPLDALYAARIQPQVDRLLQMGQGSGSSLKRKPITWHGLRGEDVSGVVKGKQGKGGMTRLRLLRNKDSVYVLFAGERSQSADATQRIDRFFKSFTLASTNPLK